jgi:hypothetical protein
MDRQPGIASRSDYQQLSVTTTPSLSIRRSSHGQMVKAFIVRFDDQGFYMGFVGGAEGIRTPDPLDANEVRYRTALQPLERRKG